MVDFFNQKTKIKEFDDTLKMVADAFDLDSLKARVDVLTKEQHSDGFWDNMAHAGEVNRELKMLETKIQKFEKVRAEVEDVKVLIELAEEADDESEVESINAEIAGLTDKIEHLRLDALLNGKYDSLNAIIPLHAGAGGTEAQDCAPTAGAGVATAGTVGINFDVFHVTLVLLRQYWNQGVPENGILFFAFRCTLSASRNARNPAALL